MPTMNEAQARDAMRSLALKAKDIPADADMTVAQKREALDKIEADLKDASGVIAVAEKARALSGMGDSAPAEHAPAQPGRAVAKSLGAQVVASEGYRNALKMLGGSNSFHTSVGVKIATVDEGTNTGDVLGGQGGAAVIPNYLPGIVDIRQRPLVIADLFPGGVTDSPIVVYVKEATFNNSAANVSETGAYPQSDDSLARVNEPVVKIAHYMKTTDELVADAPAYQSFLNARLMLGVKLKEQDQLLNGSGTLPQTTGVLNRSGLQTAVVAGSFAADNANWYDAVYQQITNIRWNAFVEPDYIVVNPNDWKNVRTSKDANGQYLLAGPLGTSYGEGPTNVDSLWGLPVVVTPAISAGTALVGGFAESGQIFRRSGVTVEMTNSNSTDFQNGLITVRAEERLALAVYRPGGFGTVTLTA